MIYAMGDKGFMLEFFQNFFDKITAFFTSILIALGIMSAPVEPVKPTQTEVCTFAVQQYDSENNKNCYAVEGGCSDGTYVYVSMIDVSVENETVAEGEEAKKVPCKIVKINASDWKTVSVSDTLYIDHANDMTYNSKTKKLVIANNKPNYSTVTIVNPETLQVEETKQLLNYINLDTEQNPVPVKIYSITYNEASDCYFCGISNTCNFAVLDSEFKLLRTFDGVSVTYTRQAAANDSNYVYSIFYKPNCIYKYDFEGGYQGVFTLPVTTNEAEFVFFIGEKMYVGYNILSSSQGGIIYSVENPEFTK